MKTRKRRSLFERFNEKWIKDQKTRCWIWQASRTSYGYGQLAVGHTEKPLLAHRYSFMIHNGEIPKDRLVRHLCDNPPCVNPDHLVLGSHLDNAVDSKRKGRTRAKETHCKNGHEFDQFNTHWRRTKLKSGIGKRRDCLTCRVINAARQKMRRAEKRLQ